MTIPHNSPPSGEAPQNAIAGLKLDYGTGPPRQQPAVNPEGRFLEELGRHDEMVCWLYGRQNSS